MTVLQKYMLRVYLGHELLITCFLSTTPSDYCLEAHRVLPEEVSCTILEDVATALCYILGWNQSELAATVDVLILAPSLNF